MSECRTSYNETTERTGSNGCLPNRYYDIHCPANGGPDYRMNYLDISCAERLEIGKCDQVTCKRHNLYGVKPVAVENKPKKLNPIRPCICCGVKGKINAYGLKDACYSSHYRNGTLDKWKTKTV